jgi:undecaprenyl-diphosphatase
VSINDFDNNITAYIQAWPAAVRSLMTGASFIGQPIVIVAVAGISFLVTVHRGQPNWAYAFIAGLLAFLFSTALKSFLHRTRPDTLYVTTMRFKSYSFPSGHSFGSLIIFGLLASLAAQHSPAAWGLAAVAAAVILIVVIGVSRIYLGAHFPTDVLGAWLLSSMFLWLIIRFVSHG